MGGFLITVKYYGFLHLLLGFQHSVLLYLHPAAQTVFYSQFTVRLVSLCAVFNVFPFTFIVLSYTSRELELHRNVFLVRLSKSQVVHPSLISVLLKSYRVKGKENTSKFFFKYSCNNRESNCSVAESVLMLPNYDSRWHWCTKHYRRLLRMFVYKAGFTEQDCSDSIHTVKQATHLCTVPNTKAHEVKSQDWQKATADSRTKGFFLFFTAFTIKIYYKIY